MKNPFKKIIENLNQFSKYMAQHSDNMGVMKKALKKREDVEVSTELKDIEKVCKN